VRREKGNGRWNNNIFLKSKVQSLKPEI